jgi:hypothetical protein
VRTLEPGRPFGVFVYVDIVFNVDIVFHGCIHRSGPPWARSVGS